MSDPTFQIPKDVIEPIIRAQVASAVATALGDRSSIIEAAVGSVLNAKVDSEGKPDKYGYDRSITWIQWLMNDCVRRATMDAIHAAMTGQREKIKAAITKELTNAKSPLIRKLVEAMADNLAADNLKYKINVTVDGK